MNKLIFSIVLVFGTVYFANAQSNALGLRFNAGYGTGVEASFQKHLQEVNRLEFGLGLDLDKALRGAAVYQWVFDLSQLYQGFFWYTGVGAGLTLYDGGADAGVLGNLGIEYNFDFQLQLSLDIRPGFYLFNSGFWFGGVALGVRYRF